MTRNELKTELGALLQEAKQIFFDEIIAKVPDEAKKHNLQKSAKAHISTPQRYQSWFSKIVPVLRQTAPDRLEEFYEPIPARPAPQTPHRIELYATRLFSRILLITF